MVYNYSVNLTLGLQYWVFPGEPGTKNKLWIEVLNGEISVTHFLLPGPSSFLLGQFRIHLFIQTGELYP